MKICEERNEKMMELKVTQKEDKKDDGETR
jgi:hypothetical protein